MYDVIVMGSAIGWVDEGSFPVSVEVTLTDVRGKVHHIIDKEPVLVSIPMDLNTTFPVSLGVYGVCVQVDGDAVEVRLAYDVVTTEGASTMTFKADDVHWL